jgi:hypothetical protein
VDGASRLRLPVAPPSDLPEPAWPLPEPGTPLAGVGSKGEILPVGWEVGRQGARALASWEGRSEAWFPWGRQEFMERLRFEANDDDPARASALGEAETVVSLDSRRLVWRSRLELASDPTAFHYRFRRELEEDGRPIREREWEATFPRDHQ